MQVLNRQDKEHQVIQLYRQAQTIREIASVAHLSFSDIGSIIRKIDGRDDVTKDVKNKSKDTQALYLFSTDKKPVDVAIELDVSASEVQNMLEEYWALNDLHELALAYNEIRAYLPSFLKLFHCLKERRMLDEKHIFKFLKYANYDLSDLAKSSMP